MMASKTSNSRPRPKFIIGEEVMIRSIYDPASDIDKTEVIEMVYMQGDNSRSYVGWAYRTLHIQAENGWYAEASLKKIPPDDRSSWESCVWQPSKEKLSI